MQFYDSRDIHRRLVADRVRTDAFRRSLVATIRPGAVVLDVGAGSGVLSLFAARAGARRVYAIERATHAAMLARTAIADNGFSNVVSVITAPAEHAVLPEAVDVIVSEWLGAYGVDENMLSPVLLCRDRWLKPGGAMIPSRVTAWLAPVEHQAGVEATAFRDRPFGLDLSALAPFSLDEAVWLPAGVTPEHLRSQPQMLWTTDCQTMPTAEARTPYAAHLAFELTGSVNGLASWFVADMPGAPELSNGPGRPLTHWGQFFFPIESARAAQRGDTLRVGFHNVPWSYGSHHIWAAQLGTQPREVHDTRRRRHSGPPWRVFNRPITAA